jgi:hypothetical protein
MVFMFNHERLRWGVGLVAGLVAGVAFSVASVHAQSVPIIVPPISPIVVGIPAGTPPVVVGIPGIGGVHDRAGVTWSESGRADVDVDIDRHHGQAAAR